MADEAKEGELEYVSDPEETKLSLKMRRREASDDEEEEGGEDGEDSGRHETFKPHGRIVDSDVESDGQGAAAEYEDEEEEEEDYDEELIDEGDYAEEDEEYGEERRGEIGEVEAAGKEVVAHVGGRKDIIEDRVGPKSIEGLQGPNDDEHFGDGASKNHQEEGEEEGGEKKEIEPYAVPTAGAFYMHDDRFRDNAGGRNRY